MSGTSHGSLMPFFLLVQRNRIQQPEPQVRCVALKHALRRRWRKERRRMPFLPLHLWVQVTNTSPGHRPPSCFNITAFEGVSNCRNRALGKCLVQVQPGQDRRAGHAGNPKHATTMTLPAASTSFGSYGDFGNCHLSDLSSSSRRFCST